MSSIMYRSMYALYCITIVFPFPLTRLVMLLLLRPTVRPNDRQNTVHEPLHPTPSKVVVTTDSVRRIAHHPRRQWDRLDGLSFLVILRQTQQRTVRECRQRSTSSSRQDVRRNGTGESGAFRIAQMRRYRPYAQYVLVARLFGPRSGRFADRVSKRICIGRLAFLKM